MSLLLFPADATLHGEVVSDIAQGRFESVFVDASAFPPDIRTALEQFLLSSGNATSISFFL